MGLAAIKRQFIVYLLWNSHLHHTLLSMFHFHKSHNFIGQSMAISLDLFAFVNEKAQSSIKLRCQDLKQSIFLQHPLESIQQLRL